MPYSGCSEVVEQLYLFLTQRWLGCVFLKCGAGTGGWDRGWDWDWELGAGTGAGGWRLDLGLGLGLELEE